jgi:hypothetical protein
MAETRIDSRTPLCLLSVLRVATRRRQSYSVGLHSPPPPGSCYLATLIQGRDRQIPTRKARRVPIQDRWRLTIGQSPSPGRAGPFRARLAARREAITRLPRAAKGCGWRGMAGLTPSPASAKRGSPLLSTESQRPGPPRRMRSSRRGQARCRPRQPNCSSMLVCLQRCSRTRLLRSAVLNRPMARPGAAGATLIVTRQSESLRGPEAGRLALGVHLGRVDARRAARVRDPAQAQVEVEGGLGRRPQARLHAPLLALAQARRLG